MAGSDPLERLHDATRDALVAARLAFAAPRAKLDLALSELDGVAPRAGAARTVPEVVKRHIVPRAIAHPEAGALHACLLKAADLLTWSPAFYPEDGYPDIPRFRDGYAFGMSVGDPRWAKDAVTTSERIGLSYTVQAPHTLYPDHAHAAVEIYYVIAGKALWKRGGEPWVERYPGEVILHETGMRHAMATADEALVACALWISHTNAPIVVVRA